MLVRWMKVLLCSCKLGSIKFDNLINTRKYEHVMWSTFILSYPLHNINNNKARALLIIDNVIAFKNIAKQMEFPIAGLPF